MDSHDSSDKMTEAKPAALDSYSPTAAHHPTPTKYPLPSMEDVDAQRVADKAWAIIKGRGWVVVLVVTCGSLFGLTKYVQDLVEEKVQEQVQSALNQKAFVVDNKLKMLQEEVTGFQKTASDVQVAGRLAEKEADEARQALKELESEKAVIASHLDHVKAILGEREVDIQNIKKDLDSVKQSSGKAFLFNQYMAILKNGSNIEIGEVLQSLATTSSMLEFEPEIQSVLLSFYTENKPYSDRLKLARCLAAYCNYESDQLWTKLVAARNQPSFVEDKYALLLPLSKITNHKSEAAQMIAEYIDSNPPNVSVLATPLRNIGPSINDIVPTLLESIRRGDSGSQSFMSILAGHKASPKEVLIFLSDIIENGLPTAKTSEESVEQQAIKALCQYGEEAKGYLPIVRQAIEARISKASASNNPGASRTAAIEEIRALATVSAVEASAYKEFLESITEPEYVVEKVKEILVLINSPIQ